MTNEEIIARYFPYLTKDGRGEQWEKMLDAARKDAKQDEFFKTIQWFVETMQYNWYFEDGTMHYDSPALDNCQNSIEELYEQFKKENNE